MSSDIQGGDIPTERLRELTTLSGRFSDSKNILQFLLQAEKPQQSNLGIEPVVFTRGDDRTDIVNTDQAQFLQSQIEEACKNSSSFLVLTPEFSLYSKLDKADPLVFDDKGNIIHGQNSVVEVFNQTKALAKKYNKNIVLSSLCEKRILSNGTAVVLNTTAIILPNGEIVFRKKVGEIYTNKNNEWAERTQDVQAAIGNPDLTQVTDPDVKEIVELTYGSLKPIAIQDNDGRKHELVVVVCQERGLKSTYQNLADSIDIVAVPISEGSFSTNRDVSAVTAYGESAAIREQLGEKFNGKNVTIAMTNERTNRASVIGYDEVREITSIYLK